MKTPLRVLVVDDSDADYRIILHYLVDGGFEPGARCVETAADLEAALADGEWDVILCDYRIPGFGAEQALEIVQRSGVTVPFIILSGVVRANEVASLIRKGAADFLEKDRLDQLVPAVEREVCELLAARGGRKASGGAESSEALYSEALYRTLLMEAPDAILLAVPDGRLVDANRQAEELLGYSRDELLAMRYVDLHPEWILERTQAVFQEIARNGRGRMPRGMIRRRDGTEVPVDINGRCVTVNGQVMLQAIFHPLAVD